MKLTITLSPTEEANIHGWVNKGLADPAFANFPTRIVLEERTLARFEEIGAQFHETPPPNPADPFADLRFRKTISEWAAFGNDFFTPNESNRLKLDHPELAGTVSLINNYYKQNANFSGERRANTFWYSDGHDFLPDVNGAADAYVVKLANGVRPPTINIP